MGRRGSGSIYLQKGRTIWTLKYKGHKKSSGTEDRETALRRLREFADQIDQGINTDIQKVTFYQLAQDYANEWKAQGYKTIKDMLRRMRKYILPFFGHMIAMKITAADVRAFTTQQLNARKKKNGKRVRKFTNGEINRQLSHFGAAFTLAIANSKQIKKPSIKLLPENNIRTGFFEEPQFRSLCKFLPEYLLPVARFAYITGWRKSEILSLQWKQVDFPGGEVRLFPGSTKNKAGRTFPFTSELREVLIEQRQETDALQREQGRLIPWVFHIYGDRFRSFPKSWKTACKKAGLAGNLFHDFRRTAIRNLVRAGVSENIAMKLCGHKTRSVFDRYDIVSGTDLKEAALKLNGKGPHIGPADRVSDQAK